MLEILVVVLFLLALCAALIVLPILVVIKAAQLLFERPLNEVVSAVNEVRDHHWRNADAVERENMVRKACGWRVIDRVVVAGALVAGASVAASSTLGFACCLAAWRMLKPIKQEMRDACAYRIYGCRRRGTLFVGPWRFLISLTEAVAGISTSLSAHPVKCIPMDSPRSKAPVHQLPTSRLPGTNLPTGLVPDGRPSDRSCRGRHFGTRGVVTSFDRGAKPGSLHIISFLAFSYPGSSSSAFKNNSRALSVLPCSFSS